MLISAGTVVTPECASAGWLTVEDGTVHEVGHGAPAAVADVDLGDRVVVPGFVDMHVHGGGGGAYTDLDEASARQAAAFHLAHGTTSSVASLVTMAPDDLVTGVDLLAGLVREGLFVGVHLEGPWLSPARCGAHPPELLRDPDPGEIDRVLAAGAGTIRMVTLAPERQGSCAAIRTLVEADVVVAIGHTDTDGAGALAAVEAGARVATHLFNAMPPLHHRVPGPIVELLNDARVVTELIVDGVHVAPSIYRMVDAASSDTVALITDAMSAAGQPDGRYLLGALDVEVIGGVARLAEGGSIAGSTATMEQVFGNAVRALPCSRAESLVTAARQAATIPAATLGLTDVGAIAAGRRADLVVLDPHDLTVEGVLRGGEWAHHPDQRP